MHPLSKLAALLWPDSEPADARRVLRNALTLLRDLTIGAYRANAASAQYSRALDTLGVEK